MLAQAAAVRRLGISFRMPNALLAALTHGKARPNPCDTAAEAGEPIAGAVFSKENGRYPKARPSLNREASRLGDVGSEDPLSGRKSRKLIWGIGTPETRRDAVSRQTEYRGLAAYSPTGIGSGSSAKTAMLLQLHNKSATTRRIEDLAAAYLAESTLGDLPQQKVAKHANPL